MTVNTCEGKITATKDMLNLISITFHTDANVWDAKGGDYKVVGNRRRKVANEIYDALKKVGYYE